ncbi:hypothetical protein H0H92_014319 [Tricholoma furcatifolium]|nr:hypothetical protein H0H92_014319 [Tricholoma furcatifolium]
MSLPNLPFYDYLGVLLHIPAYPLSADPSRVPQSALEPLIQGISCGLKKTPTSTIVRAASDNLTLEAAFDDGQRIIARKVLFTADLDRARWCTKKLRIESRLLEILPI